MGNKQTLALIILGLSITACNGTVKQFVSGVTPPTTLTPTVPVSSVGTNGFKISPGKMTASVAGPNPGGISANITATHQTMTSADVSAVVSLSRIRVVPP